MKKVVKALVKMMLVIVTIIAVKYAVVDMWDCYLACDMIESVKKVMMF